MTEHSYTGVVARGSRKATALGFPTVNIPLDENISGIFAAKVLVEEKEYFAAAFADPARKILEAHLIDFADDLYGRDVTIELVEKIRENKKFDDNAALKAAIDDDVAKVREYFHS